MRMGLADVLMRGVTGKAGAMAIMRDIATTMEQQQEEWISGLRAAGVKAAHPDDGWVDRDANTVCFVYPQFDDGVNVGNLIALGWPTWSGNKSQHRIVRVTGRAGRRWEFEPFNAEPMDGRINERS